MSAAAPAWTTWVLLAAGAGAAVVYVGERSSRDPADGHVVVGTSLASRGEAVRAPNPLMDELRAAMSRKLQSADVSGEPFAGFSWVPPPPPAPPPAKPAAPPFPYKYAGRIKEESGATRIYLTRGPDMLLVNVGDLLDGVFRVETLSDERIDIVYVPGGDRMSFELASLTGAPAPPSAAPIPPRQVSPTSAVPGFTPQAAAGPVPPATVAGAPFIGGGAAPAAAPASSASSSATTAPKVVAAVGSTVAASAPASVASNAPAASTSPGATATAPQTVPSITGLGVGGVSIGVLGAPISGPPIGFTPTSNSMIILPAPSGTLPTLPPTGEKLGL